MYSIDLMFGITIIKVIMPRGVKVGLFFTEECFYTDFKRVFLLQNTVINMPAIENHSTVCP